jgi:hypothetical protein
MAENETQYESKFGYCFRCGEWNDLSPDELCGECLKLLDQTKCEYSTECWRFSKLMAIPCHNNNKDDIGIECGKHREIRERKLYAKNHGF